ncbi:uncharacterized protein (TIGR02284 family) [Flavobacterium sp. 7E]|uniref:PA2169 family four-helix-bundle protein n=1 Tax=unclassified Flavobacterium TaxID=196869 RepID=UPI0015706066|nr:MULTISPECIES: PA2169 family four-helix-bundle protein [unclassified Flavobacterium]MBE0393322.1 hypothetical protein [Flavobacterium sp. PL002]NRS90262.1 uncharacterized protein (TIGR02284 family) [Flavobacterium sp. 7E]NRT14647.1 uncharacterized protein (TIGR02284 family) [Flavobacterium sp. 28A]
MNPEIAINVLNSFIIINNDRIERYKVASRDITNYSLKKAFENFQKTSQKCKMELSKEIIKLGGTPLQDKSSFNSVSKFWLAVKNNFIYKDIKKLISSCEINENEVMKTYYDTIYSNRDLLTDNQQLMLSEQYFSINTEHYEIKSFKDNFFISAV